MDDISKALFKRAENVMPGGVNSPVRAFKSIGSTPIFIKSANGCNIIDEDNNEYIDYVSSWGPMILGHKNERVNKAILNAMNNGLSFGAPTRLEVEMAEIVTQNIPHIDMIRMVNSGTEAVMSALRLARGYTKRDKVIKFTGCYHGHCDSMLVKSGSGTLTFTSPNSDGVTKKSVSDTLIAEYNNLKSVEELFCNNKNEIACIIVEPVAANMGVIPPKKGFLEGLRKLCDENKALLIFDEVITGFRLSFGGAAQYFNITPDIVTYGKIIGGGMPVGAYGGRREIMKCISPCGSVYQAGTLSGNPIAMTAGIETLKQLLEDRSIYENINKMGEYMASELKKVSNYTVNSVGSLCCLFLTEKPVETYNDAMLCDTDKYAKMFLHLIENKVNIAPAQFEAMFIGNSHKKGDIDYTVKKISEILKKI